MTHYYLPLKEGFLFLFLFDLSTRALVIELRKKDIWLFMSVFLAYKYTNVITRNVTNWLWVAQNALDLARCLVEVFDEMISRELHLLIWFFVTYWRGTSGTNCLALCVPTGKE